MLEITGDMWKEGLNYDAVCITTNGSIRKSDGWAVMGRGCAREAAKLWSDIPYILGDLIQERGNVVQLMKSVMLSDDAGTPAREVQLVSFPVKPGLIIPLNMAGSFDPPDQATMDSNVVAHMRGRFKPGEKIPGWACLAQSHLIEDSARQLVYLTTTKRWRKVLLPRPGCSAGELRWENVRPILNEILDDRFTVITRKS
jgi:hypothetical protein